MRVAVVAPPYLPIPPTSYGGVEAVVALLVDGLVERGHQVTLIAAGPGHTSGRHLSTLPEVRPNNMGEALPELLHGALAAGKLRDLEVDVVSDHTVLGPLLAGMRSVPTLCTWHHDVTGDWGDYIRAASKGVSIASISRSQQRLAPDIRWQAVLYNALDLTAAPFRSDKDDFVLWLGRACEEKGPDLAIDIARRAGRRIVLAGKARESSERRFFDSNVRDRLGEDAVWVGEVGAAEKFRLLSAASCLLLPLNWDEPFGMVMIEAMACGTPVVATARGAVPEIVVDGVTGFVGRDMKELVSALDRVGELSAEACRQRVADCFSRDRMVDAYERQLCTLLSSSSVPPPFKIGGKARGAKPIGANEIGAKEIGAKEIGAKEIRAKEIGKRAIGAKTIVLPANGKAAVSPSSAAGQPSP